MTASPSPVAVLSALDALHGSVFADGSRLSLTMPTRKVYYIAVGSLVCLRGFASAGVEDCAAIVIGLSNASTPDVALTRLEVAIGRPSQITPPPEREVDYMAITRGLVGG